MMDNGELNLKVNDKTRCEIRNHININAIQLAPSIAVKSKRIS